MVTIIFLSNSLSDCLQWIIDGQITGNAEESYSFFDFSITYLLLVFMMILIIFSYIRKRSYDYVLLDVMGIQKRHKYIFIGCEYLGIVVISILGGILFGAILSEIIKIELEKIFANIIFTEINYGFSPFRMTIIIGFCVFGLLFIVFDEAISCLGMDSLLSCGKKSGKPVKTRPKKKIRKLLEIAKRHDNIYLEILLCLFCGLRIGEVRGLNFDHVDLENHTITVMQQAPYESFITIKTEHGVEKCLNEDCIKPPKSGSSYRTIKVPDIVADELYRRREKNKQYFKTHPNAVSYWRNYICIGFGGELISSKTVTEGLYKICKKNGLPKISAHGLRHLCATILLEQNVPLEEISHILGHASVSTTFDIYCGEIQGRDNILDFLSSNFDPITHLARKAG